VTYTEVLEKYEVVIGIETHVQLATKSKLFCSCDNDARDKAPNTTVCPVCFGMPGTLPVLNRRAIELAIRTGLALNGKLGGHTKWDRKNYFYPDLPKGYQISQFDVPIVGPGWLNAKVDGEEFKVGITRAHLEEDAGKLVHPEGADYSLVDLNRAGTPLLEIVSEPDLRSAAQARAYAEELHKLIRYAGVSEADLYYGNMRFDVNVSLRPYGRKELGTRTETKNLNSFRAIERAVEYEAARQAEVLDDGGSIRQETRGWNEDKAETYPMRSKEDADEYRYFPEPDLPPLEVTEGMIAAQRAELGVMPHDLRRELLAAGLPEAESEVLVGEPDLAKFWQAVVQADPAQARFALNWLIIDQVKLSEAKGKLIESGVTPAKLAAVGKLSADGALSSTNAKRLLEEIWSRSDAEPSELAEELGLIQQSDTGELEKVVDAVITANPAAAADYQAGNQRAMGALVGAAMKETKGQGNPQLITDLIKQKLG
jgi:aspartyl-tRNA(Asn)/glutamyl-tRNA(Gln) amidotransferase subunit B